MPVAGALFSNETANQGLVPPQKISDVAQRGRQKMNRNSFTLSGQVTGSLLYLGKIPAGARFNKLNIVNSVSLGAAVTLAIGFTAATYNDLMAATLFTGSDAPSHQGKSTAMAAAAFTADTDIYALTAGGALPGAGTLIIDVEYIES